MSSHSLETEVELLKLPPVKPAPSTPDITQKYQKYKNPDVIRLKNLKESYVAPHVAKGYKFMSEDVRGKSSNHWKKRASHFNKQIKTDADFMLKVQHGHKKPERCVCGKMQSECHRPDCLLEVCKIKAYNKHVEKLELMWINFGKDISSLDDLSLNEQIKIVEVDNGEPVLPSVTRTMFEHLKDEKKISKRFDIQNGWMCEICHALNIRELEKCGTCGREKGNKVTTNEEEYLEKLRKKYLEHKLRGTKEERLVEKKTLAEQRLEERKERIRKRKEQLLQEKRDSAVVYDDNDNESEYDSDAEDNRIADEQSEDDDEIVWHLGKKTTLGRLKEIQKAEQEKNAAMPDKKKSKIAEILEQVDPITPVKISVYSSVRDNLDRETKVGKFIRYVFGTDLTDSIQSTEKRALLRGNIQWQKSLYREYEEKANEIEKKKSKRLKKARREARKQQALMEQAEGQ